MINYLVLIIILSIVLSPTATLFIITIQLRNKRIKELKNTCKVIGEDIYNITSRMNSGNVSHCKGNIQNMANLLKQIGEKIK